MSEVLLYMSKIAVVYQLLVYEVVYNVSESSESHLLQFPSTLDDILIAGASQC